MRIAFRHFPRLGQNSVLSALASECAADQDTFWPYHDLLFDRAAALGFNRETALGLAEEVGVDVEEFAACYDSERHVEAILAEMAEGREQGVFGTPTVYVDGVQSSGTAVELLREEIEQARAAGG